LEHEITDDKRLRSKLDALQQKMSSVNGVLPKSYSALSRRFCEAQNQNFHRGIGASQKRRDTKIPP